MRACARREWPFRSDFFSLKAFDKIDQMSVGKNKNEKKDSDRWKSVMATDKKDEGMWDERHRGRSVTNLKGWKEAKGKREEGDRRRWAEDRMEQRWRGEAKRWRKLIESIKNTCWRSAKGRQSWQGGVFAALQGSWIAEMSSLSSPSSTPRSPSVFQLVRIRHD